MGLNVGTMIDRARYPERYPDKQKGPTFDPVCTGIDIVIRVERFDRVVFLF